MKKLNHLQAKRMAEAGVFGNVASYEEMEKSIVRHGRSLSATSNEDYADFVGAAFEVYTEFFFTRYGTEANPPLGVKHISDTSRNKFQVGYDFTYENFQGEPCILQVKFRSNPTDRFGMGDLGTLWGKMVRHRLTKNRAILFTNLSGNGEDGVWMPMEADDCEEMIRVFGCDEQEVFIDRDPSFWSDLCTTVNLSLVAPRHFVAPPPMWEHQVRMNDSAQGVMRDGSNGRLICATGGGKTRVIYQNVMDGFEQGFELQVIVAPTIDLLRQHHAYFERYGAFHEDGVSVVHFRTGDTSEDGWANIRQTTSPKDLLQWRTGKTLVFVTYASEFKLFEGLRQEGVKADLVCWDEYHHSVQQKTEQLEHMLTLPSARNLFYSASVKRGRLVCGTDDAIFGPLLCEVKYAELRLTGILVPRIAIKVLVLGDGTRIKGLERELKKAAKEENFDLRTAVIEVAGTIVARKDMLLTGYCNAVTFSKAVPICKEMVTNDAIRAEFGDGLLNTVHAGVPSRYRKKVYDLVEKSHDSVLCQFSVVKEGIDMNPFNCVIFSRNMDVIGTQQAIGRAVRANPEDMKGLREGRLSLTDPVGWKKHTATMYVIMHNEDTETFRKYLKDLVLKLQYAGFKDDDYAFVDIDEGLHGKREDDDWVVPKEQMKNIIGAASLQSAVKAVQVQLEVDEREAAMLARYRSQGSGELLELL